MLTPKQKSIFEYIKKYIKEKGYSPSLEEMGRRFKLAKSTIHGHIETLKEKGYLEKSNYHARSIEILKSRKPDFTEIPLLGTISAGGPIEAVRNPESIEVPHSMLSRGANHYALKVSGTSMIEEGISEGDIVIIREQQTVDDGEKAVAYLPDRNEVALKKIYRGKNRTKLVPANKTMKPFYEKNVDIQGKVLGVIRRYG